MTATLKPADQLLALAGNTRWSWHRQTADLLNTMPGASSGVHPIGPATRLVSDPDLFEQWWAGNGAEVERQWGELSAKVASASPPEIAYFSPEFGVAAEIAQYSGGLGILAGDHLKASDDLGLPLVGVGLFYHQGFFRQQLVDASQLERYESTTYQEIGAVNTGVETNVTINGHSVAVAIHELMVGTVRLILLDTQVGSNPEWAQSITDGLYSGDNEHRLHQEMVLGIGGVRALQALGISPDVYHLNEGHASLLLLELLAQHVEAGATIADATEKVRSSTLFTTHTPVPAGIDRFSHDLIGPELKPWATRLGTTAAEIISWATLASDGPAQPFNAAAFAIHFCGRINGVSQLHSTVSRELFGALPRAKKIEAITNGVHARTWVDPQIQDLFDSTLGTGWDNGEQQAWDRVAQLDRERFESVRAQAKHGLIAKVQNLTGVDLDPERCIVGFARRFATYKRAALLLRDEKGLARSLEAGAQFVFAGKAHPADAEGKAVLSDLARFASTSHADGQIVIVPDYDIDIAKAMYWGVDVWLNNPIRPHEACGTSGEKAALNGVLNASILDGWWADWYSDGIGWVIPSSEHQDPNVRDDVEASSLHEVLAGQALEMYNNDRDAWWRMTLAMFSHLGPLVTAGRMVGEYRDRFYDPIRRR